MSFDYADLIPRIYEAAVVSEMWPSVLGEIARTYGFAGGHLFALSDNCQIGFSSMAVRDVAAAYNEDGWPSRTDRADRIFTAKKQGFLTDLDVYTAAEMEREPVFQEFLIPQGMGWGTAAGLRTERDALVVNFERPRAHGPVEQSVINQLDGLRPQLLRAVSLTARLGLERARSQAEALQAIGQPAAILRRRGALLAANPLFASLMPAVVLDNPLRVRFADRTADAAFGAMLAGDDGRPVRSLAVSAHGVHPAFVGYLLPLPRAASDALSGAAHILVLSAMTQRSVPDPTTLAALFRLTPAEARTAQALALGRTIAELAEGERLSRETIRSQLRSVFDKTGVRRQTELVALLAGRGIARG